MMNKNEMLFRVFIYMISVHWRASPLNLFRGTLSYCTIGKNIEHAFVMLVLDTQSSRLVFFY